MFEQFEHEMIDRFGLIPEEFKKFNKYNDDKI